MAILPNPHLSAIKRDLEGGGDRRAYIRLDRNERAAPPPPELFAELLASFTPDLLLAYPDPAPLIERLSRRDGLPVDHFCVAAGSDGAIRRAFTAFIRPGDRVVAPDPTYAMYPLYARMHQAEYVAVPHEDDLSLDPERFRRALTPGVRLAALANPAQPCGGALPAGELERIIIRARDVGAVCLIDEAYYPFHPETVIDRVREFDNLLVVRSFSKAVGFPGLRLGYGAARPELLQGLHAVRGNCEVAALSLAAGCFVLDRPEMTANFCAAVAEGREIVLAAADEAGFGHADCRTNFQLLFPPPELTPDALTAGLRRRGYLIKGGYDFPPLRHSLRVSLDAPEVMRGFAAAFLDATRELRALSCPPTP